MSAAYRKACRKGYEWPRVMTVHPEHGAFRGSVHGVRAADGTVTLIAFHGQAERDETKMVDTVFAAASAKGDDVIELNTADISDDLCIMLAAQAFGKPDARIFVLAGSEWGFTA